jgi:hypothetical protein
MREEAARQRQEVSRIPDWRLAPGTDRGEIEAAWQQRAEGVRQRLENEEAALKSQSDARREKLRAERAQAEEERRLARMQDDFAEGGRVAERRLSAFDFGLSETDRLLNVGGAARRNVSGAIFESQQARARGETGAREAGEAQRLGVQMHQSLLSLDERRYKIARDIVQARLEENEASSKALLFASREDQLRAALLAKYQQQGGRLSNERFAYLSDDTRRAVQEFTPDLLPSGARTDRQKLEQEQGRLLSAEMETFRQSLLDGIKALREGIDVAPEATAMPVPQVNVGGVNITFGAEIDQIVRGINEGVRAEMAVQMASVQATLATLRDGAGRAAAQTAGAAVLE